MHGGYSRLVGYAVAAMRILLVDDSRDIRDCYRAMLELLGHEVAEAATGKEAIASALKQSPELILIDLGLPDLDGVQASAALRAISSFTRLPIVAMTAQTGPEWQEKAMAAGCDDYLQKPLSRSVLEATVQKFSSAS
jgi:CheY-like chemotaxis protein